jgi:hypothetical protein
MLRLAVVLVILCTPFINTFAQDSPIDAGSVILSGSFFYQSFEGKLYEDSSGNKQTILSLSPEFGVFLSKGFMIGGKFEMLDYTWGHNMSTSVSSLGPILGFYFATNSEKIKGSIYPYLKFFMLVSSEDIPGTSLKLKTRSFGGKIGTNIMLSSALALDAGIQYQTDSATIKFASGSVSGSILVISAGITGFLWN